MTEEPIRIADNGAPSLLVSVRDASEVKEAISAGVDIVDLKEPRRGALAPADRRLWQETAALAQTLETPPIISAALGERADALDVAASLPAQFAFAKVGPSGCDRLQRVRDLWADVDARLSRPIELVGVAYADAVAADSIEPEEVFALAIDSGLKRCLLDTFVKDGRSSIEHMGLARLKSLAELARERGLWWTLAGSVTVDSLLQMASVGIRPDCYGVRGDVCDRGRTGKLSSDRILRWKESLAIQFADGAV